jgi:hypothetical protein
VQQCNLLQLLGQVGFAGDRPQDGELCAAPVPDMIDNGLLPSDVFGGDLAPNISVPSCHHRKRTN